MTAFSVRTAPGSTSRSMPEGRPYTWRGHVASPAEIVAQLHEQIAARKADGFVSYVYGATIGSPSRGRPRRKGCGTAAGAQQHYRAGEKPCEPCRLAASAARRASAAARRSREEPAGPPPVPVPETAPPPAQATRCRSCGYLTTAPGHLAVCGSAR